MFVWFYRFENLACIEEPAENSLFVRNMSVGFVSVNKITVGETKRK
jgi:hypothetical protein